MYDDSEVNLIYLEDLSYLLYTSETTSTPKRCLLAYEGLAQAIFLLSWYIFKAHRPPMQYIAVACRSICLLLVYATYWHVHKTVVFDVHLAEIFVPLSVAMTLVSAPHLQLLKDLSHWLRYLCVTHIGIVLSLIKATCVHLKEMECLTVKSILQTFITLPVVVKKGLTQYNNLLWLLAGIIFTYSLSIRFLNNGQAIHVWSWWTFMGGCCSFSCTSFVH